MQIMSISPSSYKVIDDCEMKYFIGNVLRIREQPGQAAIKGTCVHYYLEILALLKKAHQDGVSMITTDIGDIKVLEPLLPFDDGGYNLKELYDKVFEKFTATESLSPDHYDECWKHIVKVLNSDENPLALNIIATEHKFSIEIDFPWAGYTYNTAEGQKKGKVRINGIIDLIVKTDDESYKFIDWKGLPLDTPIPTPTGWTTMGDIKVGDKVIDIYGKPATVIGKSKEKIKPCYKITFDDKTTAICDDEHLWALSGGKTVPITELKIGDRIDVAAPMDLPAANLPIDPYLLGVWLGDGRNRGGEISGEDSFIFDEIKKRGYALGENIGGPDRCRSHTVYELTSKLRKLDLLNNKHIPAIYLRASHCQRLDLLRGLMDSDGNSNPTRKQAVFTNCNKQLSLGVKELLLTLGQRPSMAHVQRPYKDRICDVYPISFRPMGLNPFLLPRKKNKILTSWGPGKSSVRRIVKITKTKKTKVTQCIMVDSPTNTYLCTENMIPTHNTGKRQDWITGKRKEYDDFFNDIQLNIYNMVLRTLYPNIKNFHICIFFTKDGGPFDLVFDEEAITVTMKDLKKRINYIRNISVPKLNKSFRCKWCEYSKLKLPDAPLETRRKQFDEIGQPMCACSHMLHDIKLNGLDTTTQKYKK